MVSAHRFGFETFRVVGMGMLQGLGLRWRRGHLLEDAFGD